MTKSSDKVDDGFVLPPEYTLTSEDKSVAGGDDHGEAVADQPNMAWMVLREIVETVVLSLVIFLLVRQGIQNYRIESHSMLPNFHEGEFVLVNKLAYRLGEPARGDVVVFHNPDNPDEDYIKRVIGLPGDVITFQNEQVYINDLPLDEPYIDLPTYGNYAGSGPVVIPDDTLFVMGDNRPNSRDSRVFGALSQDLVVGKAWLRVWPFSQWGLVSHPELIPGVPSTASP